MYNLPEVVICICIYTHKSIESRKSEVSFRRDIMLSKIIFYVNRLFSILLMILFLKLSLLKTYI